MAAVALATSSARCDMVFLIMSVQTPNCWTYSLNFRHKKASIGRLIWRCFSFHLSRASLLKSGAKVKEEAENSSIHACVTL